MFTPLVSGLAGLPEFLPPSVDASAFLAYVRPPRALVQPAQLIFKRGNGDRFKLG
jgi:hypothetical protein